MKFTSNVRITAKKSKFFKLKNHKKINKLEKLNNAFGVFKSKSNQKISL